MFIDQHTLKNTIWAHMEQDQAQKKYNISGSTQYKNEISIKEFKKNLRLYTPDIPCTAEHNHRAITYSSCCHLINFNSSLNNFTVI